MTIRSLFAGAVVAAASLGLVQAAFAQATVTSSVTTSFGSYAVPAGQTLAIDFGSGVNNTTHTVSQNGATGVNVYTATGTTGGLYDAPTGDGSAYAYVSANPANGSAVLNFATPISSLSLLWGSIDAFNTISFSNGGTVTGTQAFGGTPDDVTTKLVNISFATPVTSATFSSTTNSFEFDNLAVTATPEPGTWTLMLGGVALVGFAMRASRRRADGVASAAG